MGLGDFQMLQGSIEAAFGNRDPGIDCFEGTGFHEGSCPLPPSPRLFRVLSDACRDAGSLNQDRFAGEASQCVAGRRARFRGAVRWLAQPVTTCVTLSACPSKDFDIADLNDALPPDPGRAFSRSTLTGVD